MSLLKLDPEWDRDMDRHDFTFHYVSIKTILCLEIWRIDDFFTFHYVSIKTEERNRDRAVSIFFTFHYVSIKTATGSTAAIAS